MATKSKIIAHCLIRNEECFVWYSINSVLPYIDKIMVWDTGSTDNTVKIIKSIKSSKILFRQKGPVSSKEFPQIRQQMLSQTSENYPWIMILDGDEVWPKSSIKKAARFCRQNPQCESIVVRTNNLVGDIYHRLPELAGKYTLAGRRGHLSIRFMNRQAISGLKAKGEHGIQGYYDKNNILIQNRNPQKIKFLDIYYHHATHLRRTGNIQDNKKVPKRSFKYKFSLGTKISNNQIPKIFFRTHPRIVPKVSAQAPFSFWILSFLFLPLKLLKRIFTPLHHGY